ncbi:MAG: HAMP domain-containing histidine kinase [Alphaproteobacteria bacterium]|nr:HAMP domain-containing histidine kinase [Alphaproteobacteria bacterium]
MRIRSLSLRLVIGAAASVLVALAIAAVLLSVLFRIYVERGLEARLNAQLDGLITVTEIGADGQPHPLSLLAEPRFRQPLSGWYWQITPASGSEAPVRSRSLWDSVLTFPPSIAAGREVFQELAGPADQDLFAASRLITLPGSEGAYVFTVAADRAEIEAETRPFTLTLVLSLATLGLVLIAAIFVQVRYGLGPLKQIPKSLADIRSGRADRLSGEFPTEVEPLAVEINALIDHSDKVVDRARTHVGNLAHALKTPLTVLHGEAERAQGGLADVVTRHSAIMTRQIDHYLARARIAARRKTLGARAEVLPVAEDLRRTLARIHEDRGIDIAIDGRAVAFRGDREDLEEMVGNLLDNACKWARHRVLTTVRRRNGDVVIRVDDDGPGLKEEDRAVALTRGKRFDESKSGSGLGLAIVSDLVSVYGGAIELGGSDLGGLSVTLVLPAAEA